jgi:hypothetical protein
LLSMEAEPDDLGSGMTTTMRIGLVIAALVTVGASAEASASSETGSARVGIVCNDKFSKPVVRIKPTKCVLLPPGASFSEGSSLVGLAWRSWGGTSAIGTGYEQGFHLPLAHIPAAVVAFQLVTCPDGTRLYTRFRISTIYGSGNVRAQRCLS